MPTEFHTFPFHYMLFQLFVIIALLQFYYRYSGGVGALDSLLNVLCITQKIDQIKKKKKLKTKQGSKNENLKHMALALIVTSSNDQTQCKIIVNYNITAA